MPSKLNKITIILIFLTQLSDFVDYIDQIDCLGLVLFFHPMKNIQNNQWHKIMK